METTATATQPAPVNNGVRTRAIKRILREHGLAAVTISSSQATDAVCTYVDVPEGADQTAYVAALETLPWVELKVKASEYFIWVSAYGGWADRRIWRDGSFA